MSLIVLSCGKAKAPGPRPAKDLYVSSTFRLARAAAERDGRPWLILSARHGLISPERVIAPYEDAVGRHSRRDSIRLAALLRDQPDRPEPGQAEVWASGAYAQALRLAGWQVTEPLARLQVGERRHWFKEHAA